MAHNRGQVLPYKLEGTAVHETKQSGGFGESAKNSYELWKWLVAYVMNSIFEGVVLTRINTDFEFQYLRGCGCILFSIQQSYDTAICRRFLHFLCGGSNKTREL